MIISLLALTAFARPEVSVESTVSVIHAPDGQTLMPSLQFYTLSHPAGEGEVLMMAAVGGDPLLLGDLSSDLYLLAWAGWAGNTRLSIGRHQVRSSHRPTILDGLSLSRDLSENLDLTLWAGWSHRQGISGYLDEGRATTHLELGFHSNRASLAAAIGAEQGLDASSIIRGELDGQARVGRSTMLRSTAVVAHADGDQIVELARLKLDTRVATGVRVNAEGSHTQTADPNSLLGQGILGTFAPDGIERVAVGGRYQGATFSTIETSAAITSHSEQDVQRFGQEISASWTPGRGGTVTIVPAYRFVSGVGGQYHAGLLNMSAKFSDGLSVLVDFGYVPYQKLNDPWDLALVGGAKVATNIIGTDIQAGLIVSRDALFDLEVRGGLNAVWRL